MINPSFLIPYYNHPKKIKALCDALNKEGIHLLVVNDGSNKQSREVLENIENIEILDFEQNSGKGYAVKAGCEYLLKNGFTHALQIDADFQHNIKDVKTFLSKCEQNPTSCICGSPIYDESIPKSRLHGRKITNFWISINTFGGIKNDGMCGFRLYPLKKMENALTKTKSNRMDFDMEVLVRAHWDGVEISWVPTKVQYAQDGVSHFQMFDDNVRISKMHARLFFSLPINLIKRVLNGKTLGK